MLVISGVEPTDTETGVESSEFLKSGTGEYLTSLVLCFRITHAKQIYRQRARVAEFPHAWIKSKCGLRQFRCRTRPKVACEVLFAVLTYNLQRYMKLSSFISR